MKRSILFLFVVMFNVTILNAEDISAVIKSECTLKKELVIKISSEKLDLSEDAVIDNTGGYVDIPAVKYYLKTKESLYYLEGVVENTGENINQFFSNIDSTAKKFISREELFSLKDRSDLRFIQKIDLEKNNNVQRSKNITTTNILNLKFDKDLFESEYKKCRW